jgi:2-keto-3-deoxy-L-rhamnonate aldolase RhmA
MENQLKQLLEKGEVTFGCWITIGHPDVAEIMANAGFDWIIFDTEHAPLSIETVQVLLQAISGTRVTPIIRVAWNDMVLIKQALDIGAKGILIPWINTREDAERAVKACRYPTAGLRGVSPRRAAKYGLEWDEYLATADKNLLIMLQIETAEAVKNAEQILAVPGVDAFFIGPADLASSLGFLGKADHPDALKATEKGLRVGKKLGVPAGIHARNLEVAIQEAKDGFQFISLGADYAFLLSKCQDSLRKVREATRKQ